MVSLLVSLVFVVGSTPAVRASDSGSVTSDQFKITWSDESDEHQLRPTGSISASFFNQTTIDLRSLTIRGWAPSGPTDPFTGADAVAASANVFRLDLVVDGLVNPPGPLALGGSPWDPAQFGSMPIYGFIELDVDNQKNSGGELEPITFNRYLANVARFGGLPKGSIGARAAISPQDYDGVFSVGPQFERSGAEFVLVLCGCFTPTLVSETGNGDGLFDAGESMIVRGRFFERMQSVAPFAGAFGGSDFGLYDPEVNLLFQHNALTDKTTISLVYALDQVGAAMLTGEPQQPMDLNVLNHVSIAESLNDLIFTAAGAFGPITDPAVATLISQWQGNNPLADLDVTKWDATALLGTAYTTQGNDLYVWSDVGFNFRFGDMNRDGFVTAADVSAIVTAISNQDGGPTDGDGIVNGTVVLANFGPNFSLYDVDYDGVIDSQDESVIPAIILGDLNGDGFVNSADLANLLAVWGTNTPSVDFNSDGTIDSADLATLLANWTG